MGSCAVGQQTPVGLDHGHSAYVPQPSAPAKPSIFDMYLDPSIYRVADGGMVDAAGQYVKSKDSVALCYAHVLHSDYRVRAFSISGTNLIWKVLNDEIRQPLSTDKSPANCQRVFERVTSFLQYDFNASARLDLWKRVKNIAVSPYFKNEVSAIVMFLMKKGRPKAEALDVVLTKPNSLSDAVACEANRQVMENIDAKTRETVHKLLSMQIK